MPKHVKRTTVRQIPVPGGWAWTVDYATFDRPSHSRPFEHWAHALVEAHRFERYKAKSALIERRRRQERLAQLWANPVAFPAPSLHTMMPCTIEPLADVG